VVVLAEVFFVQRCLAQTKKYDLPAYHRIQGYAGGIRFLNLIMLSDSNPVCRGFIKQSLRLFARRPIYKALDLL